MIHAFTTSSSSWLPDQRTEPSFPPLRCYGSTAAAIDAARQEALLPMPSAENCGDSSLWPTEPSRYYFSSLLRATRPPSLQVRRNVPRLAAGGGGGGGLLLLLLLLVSILRLRVTGTTHKMQHYERRYGSRLPLCRASGGGARRRQRALLAPGLIKSARAAPITRRRRRSRKTTVAAALWWGNGRSSRAVAGRTEQGGLASSQRRQLLGGAPGRTADPCSSACRSLSGAPEPCRPWKCGRSLWPSTDRCRSSGRRGSSFPSWSKRIH